MRISTTALSLCLLLPLVGCGGNEHQDKPEGLRLLEVNGCIACHSLDGSKRIGPSLNGLYGSEVVVTTNGSLQTVTVDRAYLHRSIIDPQVDIVEGYQDSMPTNFKTQISDKNLNLILDYLETIGKNTP